MSSNDPQKNMRSVYDNCDPHYLRELREAAGIDEVVLARTACLSVQQVRQLETNGGDNLFYSDAIKRQAYKRLLMILGAEPPSVEVPESFRDVHQVTEAHLNTLDQIVAMDHQPVMNRSTKDALLASFHDLKAHKQMLSAMLLLVVAVVLFVFYGPQSLTAVEAHVVEPAAAVTQPVSPVAAVATTAAPAVPALVVAPVASTPAAVAPVAVSSAAISPVTSAAASATANAKSSVCAFSTDSLPLAAPVVVQKEGRYVYFVSSSAVDVCVVDGNKQVTTMQMKAGENRSVYGVSPWQISSASLPKLQIYFQGGRVVLPDSGTSHVKLVEAPVAH